ncbi:MAG: hypothetical protein HRF46_09830 [Acidobacteriota bacterium]|jgi:hypothetical protein
MRLSFSRHVLVVGALFLFPLSSQAAPPDACTFVTLEEVNSIAKGEAKARSVTNHPRFSECSFQDASKSAVYTLKIEVDDDPRASLAMMRRGKPAPTELTGIGDEAIYHPSSRAVFAAKGKWFISSYFTGKNSDQETSAAFAAKVIARIK